LGLLEFIACLCGSAVGVAVARARRGPLRPGWSFGFEVVNRAQKRFHERVARRSPQRERRAWGALRSQGRAFRRCRTQRREIGGVPSLLIDPPETAREDRLILYLHGGGFMYGSERSHGELCARIALATGARIVFPFYRLAPEHPFPAALDDARAVWEALVADGVDPARGVIAGDSAGGNLSLALLIALRDAGVALPAAGVALSPWVDLAARGGSQDRNEPYDWASPWMQQRWARAYLGDASPREPLVSPAHADLAGLPDLCLLVGDAELLYDQVTAFADKAQRAGVDVTLHEAKDMTHLWLSLPFEASETALGQIAGFVRSRVAGSGPAHAREA
jgi:acetyl esterase/lipase